MFRIGFQDPELRKGIHLFNLKFSLLNISSWQAFDSVYRFASALSEVLLLVLSYCSNIFKLGPQPTSQDILHEVLINSSAPMMQGRIAFDSNNDKYGYNSSALIFNVIYAITGNSWL